MRVTCRYRRRLATPTEEGAAPLGSLSPVFHVPAVTLGHDDVAAFAGRAGSLASRWLSDSGMRVSDDDEWVVDVAVYASGDQERARPLVELSDITVPMGGDNGG